MNKIKCIFWLIGLTMTSSILSAQVKDSIPVKSNLFSKIKLAKVNLFKKGSKDEKGSKIAVDTKNDKKPVAREEKTFEIVRQKDTATKKNSLSKISLPKKNTVSEDSAMRWEKEINSLIVKYTPEKDSSSIIPKETATNEKSLSNLSLPSKNTVKRDSAVVKVKDSSSLIAKDTTKKSSWLSRLSLTKKNSVKKDSAKAKDTIALIAKAPATKESDLSKLSSTNKNKVNRDSVRVKVKDTVALIAKDTTKKSSWLSRLNLNKKNTFKKDSTKAKDTIAFIAKAATAKESDLPKLSRSNKNKVKRDTAILNSKDTIALIVKDAASKQSDLSKLNSPSGKNKVQRDSAKMKAKDSVALIVKDTTKKSSWLSRLNLNKKNSIKKDSKNEKVKDSSKVIAKDTSFKESSLSTVILPKKNSVKQDTAIVSIDPISKSKDSLSFHKSTHQKFLQYMATTTVSLMSGASFSKQTVDAGGFKSNFNYVYSDIIEDVYKTGYLGGVRVDGLIKKKHEYSVSFSVSKIASGTDYSSSSTLSPVVGSFSTFKAEDRFWVMNVAGHYKKLLPYGNLKRYKFYIVGGPSMDTRLSKASLDNQVTDAYRKIFLKADLGLEFSNRSLYTLFFNYQQNVGSITKTPIKTNLNSFQLGIIIKAKKIL